MYSKVTFWEARLRRAGPALPVIRGIETAMRDATSIEDGSVWGGRIAVKPKRWLMPCDEDADYGPKQGFIWNEGNLMRHERDSGRGAHAPSGVRGDSR